MSFTILVVDDDLEDHMMMKDYFEELNHQQDVKFVLNGNEAIRFLESVKTNQLPKLIILDLNMPIMNGTQTLLHIKRDQALKNIPVIIFSTSENETEKRKCLSFGAVDYLVKPMSFAEGIKQAEQFLTYTK